MSTITREPTPSESNQERRYRKAAALLRKWMAEPGDYDERVGDALAQELKDSALRCRDDAEPPA